MPYGFGIIGCGMIARFHAKAIADVLDAKLVACFNRSLPAAERFAAEVGCRCYTKLEDMLADPAVHIVTVATPSGAHLEPAVAAANAGKHVIIEKPLEITLNRCDAIITACEKNNVKLSVIFPSRFHDSSQKMKWAIENQRFGRMILGDAYVKWFRSQQYYDSGAWRGTWKLDGGGALMNQAIHSVDLLIWLMGSVVEVTANVATLAHEGISVENTCVATLRFANGTLGIIEATTAVYPGYLKRIEIHGSQGTAIMEEADIRAWDFAVEHQRDKAIQEQMAECRSAGGGASDPASISHHGHSLQFAEFVNCIKENRNPPVNGYEGRRSVELVLAIYQSAEIRKTVPLPLAVDPILAIRQHEIKTLL